VSLSAGAMNADFFTKNKNERITTYNSGGIDTTIYTMVDVMPSFPGGPAAFTSHLARNITYPAADREKKVSGKVIVTFIVELDGSLSHFNTISAPSETLKAEAIRMLAKSPKWIPGQIGGKPVRTNYIVPVNFTTN
jgi:protein TonB